MAKKIKKPKPKKFPKKPKAKAKVEVFLRYKQKCLDIIKENDRKVKEWQKALKKAETDEKIKKSIMAFNPKVKSKRY